MTERWTRRERARTHDSCVRLRASEGGAESVWGVGWVGVGVGRWVGEREGEWVTHSICLCKASFRFSQPCVVGCFSDAN